MTKEISSYGGVMLRNAETNNQGAQDGRISIANVALVKPEAIIGGLL